MLPRGAWDENSVQISGEVMEGPEQRIFHSAEMEPSWAMTNLLAEVRRLKPLRLVIDSLSDLRLISEDLISFRRFILAARREFGADENCTVREPAAIFLFEETEDSFREHAAGLVMPMDDFIARKEEARTR